MDCETRIANCTKLGGGRAERAELTENVSNGLRRTVPSPDHSNVCLALEPTPFYGAWRLCVPWFIASKRVAIDGRADVACIDGQLGLEK